MLQLKDPKEKREEVKNKAVESREAGNLEEAIELFKNVIAWDEENNNFKGKADVLGHLRTAYTRTADSLTETNEIKYYRQLAMETAEDALQINPSPVGKIHSASARFDYSEYLPKDAREAALDRALSDINKAIKELSGSEAHKAWPNNLKAKIEYALGKKEEAIQTIFHGLNCIYNGYDDEIKNDDQAQLKLNVWMSGLQLTLADICSKENKPIMAKLFATAVLSIEDPKNMLGERKKEAQRILDHLK